MLAPWQPLLEWWFGWGSSPQAVADEKSSLWFGKHHDDEAREYFGELVEPGEDRIGAVFGFDDDDVGRRRRAVGFDRGGGAAHLDFDMRLAEPAVFAGRLHGGGGFNRFAKSLYRHPWRRRDMFLRHEVYGRRRRHWRIVVEGDLIGVFDHLARSLILPAS